MGSEGLSRHTRQVIFFLLKVNKNHPHCECRDLKTRLLARQMAHKRRDAKVSLLPPQRIGGLKMFITTRWRLNVSPKASFSPQGPDHGRIR